MQNNSNTYNRILLISAALLLMLILFDVIDFSADLVIAGTLILYSVPLLYSAVSNSRRLQIIVSAVLFFIGILFTVTNLFEILDPLKVVVPSILFVSGIIFLLLFFENQKNKPFFAAGIFLAAAGIASVIFYGDSAYFYYTDKLILFVINNWHLFLIAVGILLLVMRKKN